MSCRVSDICWQDVSLSLRSALVSRVHRSLGKGIHCGPSILRQREPSWTNVRVLRQHITQFYSKSARRRTLLATMYERFSLFEETKNYSPALLVPQHYKILLVFYYIWLELNIWSATPVQICYTVQNTWNFQWFEGNRKHMGARNVKAVLSVLVLFAPPQRARHVLLPRRKLLRYSTVKLRLRGACSQPHIL